MTQRENLTIVIEILKLLGDGNWLQKYEFVKVLPLALHVKIN
jgi:hypothetical protein